MNTWVAIWMMSSLTAGLGQATPDVIVQTIDGPQGPAPLVSIGPEFTVKLGGRQPVTIRGTDLIALRQIDVPLPSLCPPPYLQLTSGDRWSIAGLPELKVDDEALRVALAEPLTGETLVPQAAVERIAMTDVADKAGRIVGDRVVFRGGDRLDGKLTRLDPKGVQLQVGDQANEIATERIGQVIFNPDFQARPRAKGPRADVILKGGVRLLFSQLVSDAGDTMTGTTLFGQRLRFAVADLVTLRVRQGRAVYLDELKPKSYESTPFLDIAWPIAIGETLSGRPLRIGADTFPFGLAMHARSRVTFEIAPSQKWFETLVAIDPMTGGPGAARIDVELDGKPAPKVSRILKSGDEPTSLRIPLQGAKTLSLVADFGPRGDILGHVLWVDARLIQE